MKKLWITVVVVIIIAGFIGLNVWKNTEENQLAVEVTTLTEETLTETMITPGTLKLAEQQTIFYTPEKGEIAEIFVQEGDDVQEGTPLLRYENRQLELEMKQKELQIRSGHLQLNDIREKHKTLDQKLEEDEENEQLQAEHDQVKLEQQQANIELEQLLLQKESLEQQIADLEVKSDIEGKVIEVNEQVAAGSTQAEQLPLMRIGSLNQLIVEGVISEYDALKVKAGQAVTLTSDAAPDQSWTGKVNEVSSLPLEEDQAAMEGGTGGVQYPIEVTVEGNIDLKPGFQMVIEIMTDQRRVNTLPLTAVKQEGDANYVYVVKDGQVEKREVKVGMVSNEMIEITDGLTKAEQVIADPADDVKDGTEVTVQ